MVVGSLFRTLGRLALSLSKSGRGGPQLHVSIRGGSRLRSFVQEARDGETAEGLARQFVRSFPMGALRNAVPRRTGRLAGSLRLERRGAAVELHGAWYGVANARVHATVTAEFMRLAERTMRRLRVEVPR